LFKDQDIMKWVKKGSNISPQLSQKYKKIGKALPALFIEQFKKYKQLSFYLQNKVEEQDIEKWINLLNKSFVWPEDIEAGWQNVFGEVPELIAKVDCQGGAADTVSKKDECENKIISKTHDASVETLTSSAIISECEKSKSVTKSSATIPSDVSNSKNIEIERSPAKSKENEKIFGKEYFITQLEESGAIKRMDILDKGPNTLLKVSKVTVGLVLAAKSTGLFSDQDIMKWIRKVKKIDPELAQKWKQMGKILGNLFVEQFKKFKELNDYLKNRVDPLDIESWVSILNTYMYVWPTEGQSDWSHIFGLTVPELCSKIHGIEEKSMISPSEALVNQQSKPETTFASDSSKGPGEISVNKKLELKTPIILDFGESKMPNETPIKQELDPKSSTLDSIIEINVPDKKSITETKFNKEYFISQLKEAGAIKPTITESSNLNTLLPVKKIMLDLVLAAKSTNMFSDQDIMKWIKKVKKVEPQMAQDWKKMGKSLSIIFIEQFKRLKSLSYYLQNQIESKDIASWKMLLNREYIWPVGEGKGWGNVFTKIPSLCQKIDNINIEHSIETTLGGNKTACSKSEKPKENEKVDIGKQEKEGISSPNVVKAINTPTVKKIDKNYFLSELEKAGAIIHSTVYKKKQLRSVPKISVGLVLCAKAFGEFADDYILNWIKYFEKMTPLLEEQFVMYKQFSLYLMTLSNTVEIQEWHDLIMRTEYVWPVGRRRSWVNIFGELSGPCKNVNVNLIYSIKDDSADVNNESKSINSQQKNVESEKESTKENNAAKTKNLTRFNKLYFMDLLTNAGALKTELVTMSFTKKTLITVSTAKLTVGVVVGAFVIGQLQGQIKQWIKKCMFSYNIDKRPGITQQMTLYSKLATYLQHDVPLDHVEEWKELLNSKYTPPYVAKLVWTNVFEKEPIICENIDLAEKSLFKKLKKDSAEGTQQSTLNQVQSQKASTSQSDTLTSYSGQAYSSQSAVYSTNTQSTTSYTATTTPAHYSAPPTTPAHYSAPPTTPAHYSAPSTTPAHYSAPSTTPAHYSATPSTYGAGNAQLPSVQSSTYVANQQQSVTPQNASYYNNVYGNQHVAHGQTVVNQQNPAAVAYGANYYQYYGDSGQSGANYAYNAQGQATLAGTYGAQDQTANYAQTYGAYGAQYMLPDVTSQTVNSNASESAVSAIPVPEDENESKKKIFFYDFPKELTDEHLKMIFNEIGEVEEFTRNLDAKDFCSIKMKDVKRVYRMFRILHGYKTDQSDVIWKVNVLNSKLFTKKEKHFASNKKEEDKIRERIKEIINPVISNTENVKGITDVLIGNLEQSQVLDKSRKIRSRSISPGKRKKRSKSRTPDRRRSKSPKRRRSRSRSPKKRSRSPKKRSRSPKKRSRSPKKRSRSPKKKSRSPDRRRRSKSRSPRRKRSRSPFRNRRRSRSVDKIIRANSPSKKIRSDSPSDTYHSEDQRSIEVENLSISLCKNILSPLFDQCGSRKMKRPTGLILPDSECETEYVFNTPWTAATISKLMNGFRIPDRHLKIKLKINKEVEKVSKEREEFTWKRIDQSLKLNQDIFVANVQTQIHRKGVYDLFGYKTRPCMKVDCSKKVDCEDYHNVYEERRDLRLHSYTDDECQFAKRGKCPMGDDCGKAHTSIERGYHMCRIHKNICPYDNLNDEKCPRIYCLYAHAETPEVLFSSSWRDVHTSGLGQTFEYLVGAIHNLRHVTTTRAGVYVLVVTPSPNMCIWLSEAVSDLVRDYRIKTAVIKESNLSI
ncbi:unnamed protein product, partial [Meganyctiphanes norvegica]